jgi:hypothetical protein
MPQMPQMEEEWGRNWGNERGNAENASSALGNHDTRRFDAAHLPYSPKG